MSEHPESHRIPAPAGKPQPLAFLDGRLYVGCWDTDSIYALDGRTGEVLDQVHAPGKPYGMAPLGDTIQVVVSIGEDDDRYLVGYRPGRGFGDPVALPEQSGSHLASDGTTLHLLQMGKRRIVILGRDGSAVRTYPLPVRLAGIGFADGKLYGIAGDEEFEHLHLATVDTSGADVVVTDIAPLDDLARGLAYDGEHWWTSYRDADAIVELA